MAKREKADQKTLGLKRSGTLNAHADAVEDPLFKENPFFDSQDLLQVRYEMLRRHSVEGTSILDAATVFGVSRPTFYQSQAAFNKAGLAGLLPKQRGPKGGHKVSDEVLDYVRELRESEPVLTTMQCVQSVKEHFGIAIHRRSLRARSAARQKKTTGSNVSPSVWEGAAQAYEILRCDLLQSSNQSGGGHSRTVLLRRGLMAWARERNNTILPTPTPSPAPQSQVSSEVANELVQLIAGLILSRRKECCNA